jgi:plasmid stabilization system protein ParE
MAFSTVIDPRAMQDIQQAIDYYENQQPGLGKQFEEFLNRNLSKLQQNPFFQVRYENVHCLPLKQHPYMIHFTVDEKEQLITVRAVLNTSRNPKIWKDRF